MRVEIRCCCNPNKLLGTVEAPGDGAPSVKFTIVGWTDPLELPWGTCELGPRHAERGRRFRALKSMETPIEVLRLIPSFEENK